MRTIRRLYFYAVALISLEVVLWGVIGLLRSIFSSRLVNTTDALAQALALVLVGVPIFLFHWLWAQHASVRDEEEGTASLRAIFFYAVIFSTLIPSIQNLLALVNRIVLDVAHLTVSRAMFGGQQNWQDNLIAIGVNLIVAAYFWGALRAAWKSLPDAPDNFADVCRLYRYLWLLYSLLMTVFGAQQVLRFIFNLRIPTFIIGMGGREMFVNGLALLLIGTPLWVYTWRVIQDSLSATVEMNSNLRLGVLYLLGLGGVISVLSASGNLLEIFLRWVFGEAMQGYEFLRDIGGPVSLGIPLAAIWFYYGGWLKHQIASDPDESRRAGKQRFFYYILSAPGLGASVIGATLLLSFIIDLLTANAFWVGVLRPRLAGALATLIVGLPLWLFTWRPMQADALMDGEMGDHARRSTIRRTYLYLALFAGVIGGMATAVGLVYLLINALLSGSAESDFLPRMLNLLQLLGLFVVVLVYHLNCLRRDNTQAGTTLESRQRNFPVLVLDTGNEAFLNALRAAMRKFAPDVPLVVQAADKMLTKEADEAKAVILLTSLVVEPPVALRRWLKSFKGEKIVVAEAVPGWILSGLSPEQAAKSARQIAEGEQVHLVRPSAAWEVVKTVAVILLGIEILFMLLGLGISQALTRL